MVHVAFEKSHRGFTVKAFYLDGPQARIEVTREGRPYHAYLYPAYRIFNIAAHFSEIVDAQLEQDERAIETFYIDGSGDRLQVVFAPGY